MNKLTALVLILVGIYLLYLGYDEYQGLSSQVNKLLSGTPSNKAIYILAAGGVSFLIGLVQLFRK